MKNIAIIFICLTSSLVFAELETWTSADGRQTLMEFVEAKEDGDGLVGIFKNKHGKKFRLPASNLSVDDADKLASKFEEQKEKEEQKKGGREASVFDDLLDSNLLQLKGKRLKRLKTFEKPEKYYLFYYTASWCPPCQKYTPKLVEFYNENIANNPKYEIILITSDDSKDDMEDYAYSKTMPWPHLKLSKTEKFKKKVSHGVKGIPSLITCSLDGEIVSRSENFSKLKELLKE